MRVGAYIIARRYSYAELFTYDDKAGELRLDEDHRVQLRRGLLGGGGEAYDVAEDEL